MDNVNIVAIILQLQNEEQDLPKYFSNLHLILLQYQQLFFKCNLFLFWASLGLHCCTGFSLVAASWGYFPVIVCEFLIVVSSLIVDNGLQDMQASADAALGLCICGMWNLCRLGTEPMPLALAGGFFITQPPGKPQTILKLLKMCISLNQTNGLQPQTKDFHNYAQWRSVSQGLQSRVRSEFWVSHLTSTRTASHIMHL